MTKCFRFFLFVLCGVFLVNNVGAFTNPQIAKLIKEKQQKTEKLEQCAKKVKGFKIAGISTLGITAVGVMGNVWLAKKQKDLERQIDKVSKDIKTQEDELIKIKTKMLKKADALKSETKAAQEQLDDILVRGDAETQSEKADIKEDVKENVVTAEDYKNVPALEECPGNAWDKIKQRCSECASENVRKLVCFYDIDERYAVNGFETDVDGYGTWLYYVPQEDDYYFSAVMMDNCICKDIVNVEKERKKAKKQKK